MCLLIRNREVESVGQHNDVVNDAGWRATPNTAPHYNDQMKGVTCWPFTFDRPGKARLNGDQFGSTWLLLETLHPHKLWQGPQYSISRTHTVRSTEHVIFNYWLNSQRCRLFFVLFYQGGGGKGWHGWVPFLFLISVLVLQGFWWTSMPWCA